jgi:hypothetical protein
MRVCSLVPVGYEAYLRILHPARASSPDRTILWSTAARWAGCVIHPEVQWQAIADVINASPEALPWSEEPSLGICPPEVITPLSEHLAEHTGSADSIMFGMWVGFSDVRAVEKGAERFRLPGREYVLLHGPVAFAGEIVVSPFSVRAGPNIWWPDDRAWCVATEVDHRSTYVGGTESCISSIERDARLETLRTEPQHRTDEDSDRLNDARR